MQLKSVHFEHCWMEIHCSSTVQAVPCYLLVQEMSTTGTTEILRNNLINGSVRLKDFSAYLKWSEFGDLHIFLL